MNLIWSWIHLITINCALTIDSSNNIPKPVNDAECKSISLTDATLEEKSLNNRCHFIPNSGLCLAAFPMYYFDLKYRECKQTIYGGCGGCMPFDTEQACESSCEKNLKPLSAEQKKKLKEQEIELEKKKKPNVGKVDVLGK